MNGFRHLQEYVCMDGALQNIGQLYDASKWNQNDRKKKK